MKFNYFKFILSGIRTACLEAGESKFVYCAPEVFFHKSEREISSIIYNVFSAFFFYI